ncbi:MAG: toprim domain-containing protein [Desulfotalea sp.]
MSDNRAGEIATALAGDSRFSFKQVGGFLRYGKCPNCGKKELYTSMSKPFRIACSRENKCGMSFTAKELLPHLFENWEKRHPATPTNPKATADAYLKEDRGFKMVVCRPFYSQENYKLKSGKAVSTIRFYLDAEKTRFWERLIGETKEDGQKANIGGKRKDDKSIYKGDVWQPPNLKVAKDGEIFITEGIFHALALIHGKKNAVAAIGSSNFAINFIKKHVGKDITWVLAYDGDKAGRKYMQKHADLIEKMGEKVAVCLLPDNGKDWDDYWKEGWLNDSLIDNSFHRGQLFMAKSVEEKAFIMLLKRPSLSSLLVDFNKAIYAVKIKKSFADALEQVGLTVTDKDRNTEVFDYFRNHSSAFQICNVLPTFLYMEKDEVLDEQLYVFKIVYQNGTKEKLIALDGTALSSSKNFKTALLNKTNGARFSGSNEDFDILVRRWLDGKMLEVQSINFVGYCPDNKAYIFPDNAWQAGKKIDLNPHGYFPLKDQGVKSNLAGINISTNGEAAPDFFNKYFQAFHHQGVAVMAFYLGSLFAQQIRAKQKGLTFLEFTGEPGSGKTTALEFCWKLLGRDDTEGIDVQKTSAAGRRRFFSQTANMPAVIVESDRGTGDDGPKGKQFNFDEFKDFYNGRNTGVIGVATKGNETRESPFRGALAFSQNAEVDGSEALLSRIVHVHMDKKHHKQGSRELAKWFELQTTASVGGFLDSVLSRERQLLDRYFKAYQQYETRFAGLKNVSNIRIVQTHAQIAAMGNCLGMIFPSFSEQMLADFVAYIESRATLREERIAADHPIVEKFWETFFYISSRNTDSKTSLNHAGEDESIYAINLNHFRERCLHWGQEVLDSTQLKAMLKGSKRYKLEAINRVMTSKSIKKSVRCWIFKK